MSTCFYCKGKLEHKLVNHIVDLGETIIIIKMFLPKSALNAVKPRILMMLQNILKKLLMRCASNIWKLLFLIIIKLLKDQKAKKRLRKPTHILQVQLSLIIFAYK